MEEKREQPKSTFSNLPAEKRDRIIAEAMREFAANGYEKASLNAVVRRLGIAKGSLYQYFTNKESLFLFLFDHFTDLVKNTLARAVPVEESIGFFATIRGALLTGIRFIDQHPLHFNLYLKVLFEPEVPKREELIAKVHLFSQEYFGPLCQRAIEQGELRRDLPVETMSFMLDAIFDRFLQGYVQPYLDGGLELAGKNRAGQELAVDRLVAAIRGGLAAPAEQTQPCQVIIGRKGMN